MAIHYAPTESGATDRFYPASRDEAGIMALLAERVDIGPEGLNVRLHVDGRGGLAREELAGGIEAAA